MTDNLARNFRDAQKQLNQIKNRPFKSKMEERMALNLASRYASDISDLTQRFRLERNENFTLFILKSDWMSNFVLEHAKENSLEG